jgi:hypothetical protein
MKIPLEEVKPAVKAGAVVHVAGQDYRKGDRIPEEFPEGVEHGLIVRDERGNLTRAGMEKIIRDGGSVMDRNGIIMERLDQLPDEAEMVKGHEEQERALAESLDEQIAGLAAQRSKLLQGESALRTVTGVRGMPAESSAEEQASAQQAAERRTQAQQQRRERERREREAQQQQREVED